MKKILFFLLFMVSVVIASAIPSGKYLNGNYEAYVSGSKITVYIDGHYFGSIDVINENDDGSFTFKFSNSNKIHNGRWYVEDNGTVHLLLEKQHLTKINNTK